MIKITHHGNGFRMRFSGFGVGVTPYSVQAKDGDEVKNAIDHHLLSNGHIAGANPESCPLCRMVVRNERRIGR
jgi:hypothetical protein